MFYNFDPKYNREWSSMFKNESELEMANDLYPHFQQLLHKVGTTNPTI